MYVTSGWRQQRHRRRAAGAPSAVVLVLLAIAAGALAWLVLLPPPPEPSSTRVVLALAIPAKPELGATKTKGAPAALISQRATSALLGLKIRREPLLTPESEPPSFEPLAPEPRPVIGPELVAPALPAPEPERPVGRDLAAVEAAEPEPGRIVAADPAVILIEPGPAPRPEAASAAMAPAPGPELMPTIEVATLEAASPELPTLAMPARRIAASGSEATPEATPEATMEPETDDAAIPPPPFVPAPLSTPGIALIYPPPPEPEATPEFEPAAAGPSAIEEAPPESHDLMMAALVEPVATDAGEPASIQIAPPIVESEMNGSAGLDAPDTVLPDPMLASGLALREAPESPPERVPAPEAAAGTEPAPVESPLAARAPTVRLFAPGLAPGPVAQWVAMPGPDQPPSETAAATPWPTVSLATFVLTAAAPQPETEAPVEFAAILPAAGPSAKTFLLTAALALEPQTAEASGVDDESIPDDMLIEIAAVAEKTGQAGRRDADVWLAYARPFEPPADRPLVAIVVLGLGMSRAATNAAIQLPGAVTLGFSSFARGLQDWIDLARAAGHEVMLDLPMEPMKYPENDPGPQALMTSLPSAENMDRLKWHLDRATGYFGVTNNMGSRFTSSPDDFEPVLSTLKLRGLMYLDSRTSRSDVAEKLASALELPRVVNDRFIDVQASRLAIDAELAEIERIARRTGFAVAIGHAFPVTIERLNGWLSTLADRGIALAPVSALVDKQAPR